jgi:hypothetical protein
VVVVYRAERVQSTFPIDVKCGLLASDMMVKSIEPAKVSVTFLAPRKEFDFLKDDDIKLTLQLWDAEPGPRQVWITADELTYPHALELENIEPRHVKLIIEKKPTEAETARP